MIEAFEWCADAMTKVTDLLDQVPMWGVISLWDLMFSGIIILMVVSVFWKGAGS